MQNQWQIEVEFLERFWSVFGNQKWAKGSQKGANGSRKGVERESNARFLEPKPQKYEQNGSQNQWKIEVASRMRFGSVLGRQKLPTSKFPRTILATIFDQKSKKWHPKMHAKIDAEKVSKIDPKRVQNKAKIDAKIIDFSIFSKRVKIRKSRSRCSQSMVF